MFSFFCCCAQIPFSVATSRLRPLYWLPCKPNGYHTYYTVQYGFGIIMQARHRHIRLADQMTGQHLLEMSCFAGLWLADADGETINMSCSPPASLKSSLLTILMLGQAAVNVVTPTPRRRDCLLAALFAADHPSSPLMHLITIAST